MKINKFYQANPMSPEQLKAMQDKQMREAAKSYEKYFLDEMVKAMRTTVPEGDGLIPANFAEKMYKENLDQEYVKNWSEAGGVGLQDLIYDQIKAQIEGHQPPPSQAAPNEGPIPLESEGNKIKGLAAYEKAKVQQD